jgi:hypothetical protein
MKREPTAKRTGKQSGRPTGLPRERIEIKHFKKVTADTLTLYPDGTQQRPGTDRPRDFVALQHSPDEGRGVLFHVQSSNFKVYQLKLSP